MPMCILPGSGETNQATRIQGAIPTAVTIEGY